MSHVVKSLTANQPISGKLPAIIEPMQNPYHQTTFTLSCAKVSQLPADEGYEVAIAGRSNVGKSSCLNILTEQKKLARVSKTPGRTQLINVFAVDDERRIMDLPGYGYAKVAKSIQAEWEKLLENYFAQRQSLKGVVLVMDIRHPLKPYDCAMIDWAAHYQMPLHILLNKADKLSRNQAMSTLHQVKKALQDMPSPYNIQLFSALKREGQKDWIHQLNQWLNLEIV